MFRTLAVSAALVAAAALPAAALSGDQLQACKAMSATLAPKQAEIGEMKEKRDALAVSVETKGESWDDAEVMRLASANHAETADTAQGEYKALKAELMQVEAGMQAALGQFNRDVADYNQMCTKKK